MSNVRFSLRFLIAVFAVLLFPFPSWAAFNAVTLTTDTVITVGGYNLNVSGSTASVESLVVNAGNFVVTLGSGSSLTISSVDKRNLSYASVSSVTGTFTCDSSSSTLALSYSGSGTASVTVTPENLCSTAATPATGSAAAIFVLLPQPAPKEEKKEVPSLPLQESKFIYQRSMQLGSRGEDVAALQTFLEQKGLLVMPRGVSKGYFGQLTKQALVTYQKSAGISPIGVFGPKTRAKVMAKNETVSPAPSSREKIIIDIQTAQVRLLELQQKLNNLIQTR